MGAEGDRVLPRFERGCRAFAVLDRDGLVAYGWLSTRPEWIGEVSAQIAPAAHEAYVWNCVTLPDHRRRGYYRALLEGIVAQARREGLLRLWIGSVDDPAEKANVDVGFVPVLNVSMRRIAGFSFLRIVADRGAGQDLVRAARQRMNHRWWSSVRPVRRHVH